MRNFDEWLNNFKFSISGYDYYADFEKVVKNVDKLKIELNILNSLIGSKDIEMDFEKLISKYPEVLKCIPILLAVRKNEIYAKDEDGEYHFNFNQMNYSFDDYKMFMRKTGLFDMLSNHIVNNLIDYVLGVETGLDSNARKSRGGHQMENLVEYYIKKAGFIKNQTYFKEMYLTDIENKYDIDLSALSNHGKTEKRFDFVVKAKDNIYGLETNFYTDGGSKLGETARSYKMLAIETQSVEGFEFCWITDGNGWKKARHNLEETFDVMEHIYNINDLENGIIEKLM